jgi:hypothetical protein
VLSALGLYGTSGAEIGRNSLSTVLDDQTFLPSHGCGGLESPGRYEGCPVRVSALTGLPPEPACKGVDLLVRYSNHEDALSRVVGVLRRIEDYDQDDEPGVRLPEPPLLRGLARLGPDDVGQLVARFQAGTAKHVLAHRYGVSLSTVKRLLRSALSAGKTEG